MISCLIMAGGRGTRFYPASTTEKPKQFLNLIGNETMLQQTVNRVKKLIPMERIFIATCEQYVSIVKEQLPNLSESNIIIEPIGRNTAPCIVLGALQINKKFKDAKMLVIPSDSLIENVDEYINVLQTGEKFLSNNKEAVITIGIKPTRPETGYGYIKVINKSSNINKNEVCKVEKFVEKPNVELATEYFSDGKYLWNAGMFMWNIDYLIELSKKYMTDTYTKLNKIVSSPEKEYKNILFELYPKVEKISIDFALMEKINSIFVIEGDFGWDDLGSWLALERYLPKDKLKNAYKGKFKGIDANNNISFSTNKKIKILGLNDVFCIESEDQIVIGNKEYLPKVHELIKEYSDE